MDIQKTVTTLLWEWDETHLQPLTDDQKVDAAHWLGIGLRMGYNQGWKDGDTTRLRLVQTALGLGHLEGLK